MRKLKLDLDALTVDTFDVTAPAPDASRGTVQGAVRHQIPIPPDTYWDCGGGGGGGSGATYCDLTCQTNCILSQNTCVYTCWATCPGTCDATCAFTCVNTCLWSCDLTCGDTCDTGGVCA